MFIVDKRSQGRVNQVDVLSGSVNRDLKAGDRNQESHATHLNTWQNTRLWVKGTDKRMVLIKKLNIEFVSPERQITLD